MKQTNHELCTQLFWRLCQSSCGCVRIPETINLKQRTFLLLFCFVFTCSFVGLGWSLTGLEASESTVRQLHLVGVRCRAYLLPTSPSNGMTTCSFTLIIGTHRPFHLEANYRQLHQNTMVQMCDSPLLLIPSPHFSCLPQSILPTSIPPVPTPTPVEVHDSPPSIRDVCSISAS